MIDHDCDWRYQATEQDFLVYDKLLPTNHPLAEMLDLIPW